MTQYGHVEFKAWLLYVQERRFESRVGELEVSVNENSEVYEKGVEKAI